MTDIDVVNGPKLPGDEKSFCVITERVDMRG